MSKKKNPYRLTAAELMHTLDNWDSLMNFRVRLIACGGTALTLLGMKESTKDVDFIVPDVGEYEKLVSFLFAIGYREIGGGYVHEDDPLFIYQFWPGDRVFTTDLLNSPLEAGNHIVIKKHRRIYLGALNLVDLIITKMFRGTQVDVDDCITAISKGGVNPDTLLENYAEAADYDLNPDKMMKNFLVLADRMVSENLTTEQYIDKVKAYL